MEWSLNIVIDVFVGKNKEIMIFLLVSKFVEQKESEPIPVEHLDHYLFLKMLKW